MTRGNAMSGRSKTWPVRNATTARVIVRAIIPV
jgi:hypothetical protein